MLRIVVVLGCCGDNTGSEEEDFFECNNYSAEAVVASVGAAAAVEVEENPVGHCGCGCLATTDSSLLPIYRRRKGKRGNRRDWQCLADGGQSASSSRFADVRSSPSPYRAEEKESSEQTIVQFREHSTASMSIRGRADGNSSGSG